jgi:hypothetical protein
MSIDYQGYIDSDLLLLFCPILPIGVSVAKQLNLLIGFDQEADSQRIDFVGRLLLSV